MARVRANPKFSIQKGDGTPANGWKVNFYVAGTSTRKDTYTSNTESTANANPVILDARGEADIWLSGTYKVVLTDENDVTIWTVDNYGAGEDQTITGNYNLVKNGSFETDATTSGEPDNWTIVDYTNGSHSLDATDQFHGLNSLKFVSTGSGGGYATSDYFEVEEAKALNFDWNMKSSVVDVRNVVDVLWYTAAKTLISTTNLYDDSTTNTTSWSAKYSQATPPSTARYAQLRVYGCHSSDTTAGSTWYDNIEVGPNLARRHTVNTFTQTQTWSKGADVASAAALTLGSDGNYFDITGTTAITSIVSKGIGTVVKLHFDDILTLTHNATDLILPSGNNIETTAGDEAEFIEYASGDWRCINYPATWQREQGTFYGTGATNYSNLLFESRYNDVTSSGAVSNLVVTTDVTKATWESVAESGADNNWSVMSNLPSDAKRVIVRLRALGYDSTTAGVYTLKVYASPGVASPSVIDVFYRIYQHRLYSTTTDSVGNDTLVAIPVDASNVFSIYWDFTGDTADIKMDIVGWLS